MGATFSCDQCGQVYGLKPELAGKRIRCRSCGGIVQIPGGAAASSRPRPDPPKPASRSSDDEEGIYDLATDSSPLADPYADAMPPPPRERRPTESSTGKKGAKKKKRGTKQEAGKIGKIVAGIFGGLFVLRWIVRLVLIGMSAAGVGRGGPGPGHVIGPPTPASFQPNIADPNAMPVFPPLAGWRSIEPGVQFQEVQLSSEPSQAGRPPGHQTKLWLYQPAGEHPAGTLPCVVVGPAGSTLLTGMGLAEGDRPEHLPYARAGFAVVSYTIDGDVPENPPDPMFLNGVRKFTDAKAGVTNAHWAIEYVKAKLPQVDPRRIYAAGHSSAATLALLVAANEPALAGVAAFMPVVDVAGRFRDQGVDLGQLVGQLPPGADALWTTYSPLNNEAKIRCPVLLFTALDDSNVPPSQAIDAADRLRQRGVQVTLRTAPSGDHYQPMIDVGIPEAIAWFTSLGADPEPATPGSIAVRPAPAPPGHGPSGPLLGRREPGPPSTPGMPTLPGSPSMPGPRGPGRIEPPRASGSMAPSRPEPPAYNGPIPEPGAVGVAANAGPDPYAPAPEPLNVTYPADRLEIVPPNMMRGNAEDFREIAPPGGVLVGFRVGYVRSFNGWKVGALQAIYQVGDSYQLGERFGAGMPLLSTVVARPGYAVGALKTQTGLMVDAFTVIFARVAGDRLNTGDAYPSDWLGDHSGGSPGVVNGEGRFAVGIQGRSTGREINALGLVVAGPGSGAGPAGDRAGPTGAVPSGQGPTGPL